ncbi:hypothetical protein HMPREF9062_0910, partial [Actinomyces sp. oral taxon 448 str. F0400]
MRTSPRLGEGDREAPTAPVQSLAWHRDAGGAAFRRARGGAAPAAPDRPARARAARTGRSRAPAPPARPAR